MLGVSMLNKHAVTLQSDELQNQVHQSRTDQQLKEKWDGRFIVLVVFRPWEHDDKSSTKVKWHCEDLPTTVTGFYNNR